MDYTPTERKCQVVTYVGIGPNKGVRVAGEDALGYALAACGIRVATRTALTEEFEAMLTEWFYSGDWMKEEQHE